MNYKEYLMKRFNQFIQYPCGCATVGKEIVALCPKHELKDFRYYNLNSLDPDNPDQ
jgi:hypothetical protein